MTDEQQAVLTSLTMQLTPHGYSVMSMGSYAYNAPVQVSIHGNGVAMQKLILFDGTIL